MFVAFSHFFTNSRKSFWTFIINFQLPLSIRYIDGTYCIVVMCIFRGMEVKFRSKYFYFPYSIIGSFSGLGFVCWLFKLLLSYIFPILSMYGLYLYYLNSWCYILVQPDQNFTDLFNLWTFLDMNVLL